MVRGRGSVSPSCETVIVIERAVDFERLRWMRCGTCSNEWHANAEWLNRFHQRDEAFPKCGTNCETEGRPDFWAAQDDPSHVDSKVRENVVVPHVNARELAR